MNEASFALRYFFKFDGAGEVVNWQVAESAVTADRLIALDYIEVTSARYVAHWERRDYWQIAGMYPAEQERTV